MNVLFFSRGRGKGHAIPDISIVQAVQKVNDEVNCNFVSYGTGAATLSEFGYGVEDLHLPEDNPFLETLVRSCDVIRTSAPDVVVSHEEFAAILAAKVCGVPAVFITDWFGNEQQLAMQLLTYAELTIFLGERGIFDEPTFLKGKVAYVGAFTRDFAYHIRDRDRARLELGISADVIVVSVLPGGWATEQRAPIFDLLIPAFQGLKIQRKLLCWVAGDEFEQMAGRTKTMSDILVLKNPWPIEQLVVASDLVVTKGNRITIMESAALGVPSVSLSHGLNPVEDFIVPRIKSNLALRVKGVNAEFLSKCFHDMLNCEKSQQEDCCGSHGVGLVAGVLLETVVRLGHHGTSPANLGDLVTTDV